MTIWTRLTEAGKAAEATRILDRFAENPNRFAEFSVTLGDMTLDFSKTSLDAAVMPPVGQ